MRSSFNFSPWIAAFVALCIAPAALADRFRVDLILFMNEGGASRESPVPVQLPDLARALDPSDAARLRAAGIEVLPDSDFGLETEWRRLQNSRRHNPLVRVAWLQKDPPAERGTGLRLRSGTPFSALTATGTTVYPVDGSVTLLMGRYLHLDADLVYSLNTDPVGEPGSLRLKERRRLRRGELHYLDSPTLGLLIKVERAP
jgi:hypothetical protein